LPTGESGGSAERDCGVGEYHGAPTAGGLGVDKDETAAASALQRAPDGEPATSEIDVLPAEAQCLTQPQPRAAEQHPQGMESVTPAALEKKEELRRA
jgi:hypothetical protein